jgi:DNA-binding response OmpR family regulator
MSTIAILTDRSPDAVLPALRDVGSDVKAEPLSPEAGVDLGRSGVEVAIVDAVDNPAYAWSVLRVIRTSERPPPMIAVVDSDGLERLPWDEVVDDLVRPGAPAAELRVRIALLVRRGAGVTGQVIRLGPLAIDTDSFRVNADGVPLDLTFKEFELLRFLAERPGRVCTRPALLREVWGYDFYGGTRTVDVHVRRLRAKLGPEHEHLIQTVRSVGYRAALDPDR